MNINWRLIGAWVLGVLIGAVLVVAGAYAYGITPDGQARLRDFLVSRVQKGDAALALTATSSSIMGQPPILPVPEAYVTPDYFSAINNIIADAVLLNNIDVELKPALERLDRLMVSGGYSGFYDLMGQARALANKNQALAAQFAIHINALAAANTQTKDAITKVETETLVVAGRSLSTALQTYATSVQSLLYGGSLTSAQIAELQSQVDVVQGASQTFADALKPLLQHIVEGDQAVIDAAATSTPAR